MIRFILISLFAFSLQAKSTIVCSITPVYQITKALLKDVDMPELLIDSQVSPHGFALKPSDRKLIGKADLVIWIGEGLEVYLAKSLQGKSKSFPLMVNSGVELLQFLDGHEHHDDGHDHHHHHSDLEKDPHIWLSVENAKKMATAIHQRLIDFYDEIEGYRITRNYLNLIKEFENILYY